MTTPTGFLGHQAHLSLKIPEHTDTDGQGQLYQRLISKV
ncbi:hypothetical protein ACDW_33560 [Acidovorax sp. DW039]|nr:hypothetical protein ACDW_33560 [Acidovorax sp. DW039]